MGLGSRSASRHETAASSRVAGVDPSVQWAFAPGSAVMTVDGVPGTVTAVLDGPHPGNEVYEVTLDKGMGGGKYTAGQLSQVGSTTASTEHTAADDYPELGDILVKRPDIALNTVLGSKTAANDAEMSQYSNEVANGRRAEMDAANTSCGACGREYDRGEHPYQCPSCASTKYQHPINDSDDDGWDEPRDERDDYYDDPDPAMTSGDPYDRHADAMDRRRTYSAEPRPFEAKTASWGPLCEEDPDEPGFCAYHNEHHDEDEPSEPEGPEEDDARVEVGTNRWGNETAYHAHHGRDNLGHFPDEARARAALWDHENDGGSKGWHPNHWVDGHLDKSNDRQEYEKDPHGWLMKNSPSYEHDQTKDVGQDVDEALEGSEHLRGLLHDMPTGPTKYSALDEPHFEDPEMESRFRNREIDAWGTPVRKAFDGHGAWNCNNYDCEEHPQSMYPQEGQPQGMPGWLQHDTASPEEKGLRKQVNDATSGNEWLLDQQHQGPSKFSARDQATCPHNQGFNLHGQCKACGYTPPTEGDEPCDSPYCEGFPEGWHTKAEHIDPPDRDPYSDASRDAQRNIEDAFRGTEAGDAGWLLDQQSTGPSHLSSKSDDDDPICICDAYAPDKRPGQCPIHGASKTSALDPYSIVAQAAADSEFRFEVTASWSDVRNKAKRIRSEGGVRIVAAGHSGVTAEVKGDHHVYETGLQYVPASRKVATWQCGCKWAAYAWGRSPRYKRFEGRMCSHALAVQFEAASRGMFGREVGEDSERPKWLKQRTPIVIQFDKSEDKNLTRRTVPPGNMRSVWSKVVEPAPIITTVAHLAVEGGGDADEIGLLLTASHIEADGLVRFARTAAIKHGCPGCGLDTVASGMCTHCKRNQVIPINHDSMDPELADKHLEIRDRLHRQAQDQGWSRNRVSQNAKMLNMRFTIEQAKRDRDNPKPGFYAHPELNELAEMTHEMRHGEGGDPTWLPSPFDKNAAVNDAWGEPAPPQQTWPQLPGATKTKDPLENPASAGFAAGPDPIGWSTISPMTMGDRVASHYSEEAEDGDTDVCANCGEAIKRTTMDPNVPWVHHHSGNSKCDVSSPSDAVMLQGIDSGEAAPTMHESSLDDGTATWDSADENAYGAQADLHDEPEPALPSTDGSAISDGLLGDQSDQMSAVYDDALSPQDDSIQSVGAVQESAGVAAIIAQFQRTAGAAAIMGDSRQSAGPSDSDIAAAAKAHLEGKTAMRVFSPEEQRTLINERGRAANTDRLDIADTHYAALDELRGADDDEDWMG